MTPRQIKLKVFRELCYHENDFMSCWIPLPTTVIAQCLNISVYQCRKAMRQLVAEGLAVRSSCPSESEDCSLPYHGFLITEKGRDTDIFRYCALKSARIFAACFDARLETLLPMKFNYAWIGKETPEEMKIYQKCKHCQDGMNVDGETLCYCELRQTWVNVTHEECFGNCKDQEEVVFDDI